MIDFWRGNAFENAAKLSGVQFGSRSHILDKKLDEAGVLFSGTSDVRDLTGLQSDLMEQRAQIELKLTYRAKPTYDADIGESYK